MNTLDRIKQASRVNGTFASRTSFEATYEAVE